MGWSEGYSIIHNGIKHSPKNGQVLINAYNIDDKTFIEVCDSGQGFTKEAKENLFQPFGLGEKHYDKNVGLNLLAAKMIMSAHNGDIFIENITPSGAKVTLELP